MSQENVVWDDLAGAIERICMHQDREDALEAVGLSEATLRGND